MKELLCNDIKAEIIRKKVILNLMCMIVVGLISITPIFNRLFPPTLNLLIFFIWLFSCNILGKLHRKGKESTIVVWWSLYWLLQLLYSFLGISKGISFVFARLYLYMIPIAFLYVNCFYNIKEKKILWNCLLLIYAINLISNFLLGINQGVQIFDDNTARFSTNVGGTNFVFANMIMIPTLWLVFRKGVKRCCFPIITCLIIASCVYILFLNTRAIAIFIFALIFVGFLFVEIIPQKKKISIKVVILFLFFLISFMILVIEPILQLFTTFFADVGRMTSRIEDIVFLVEDGDIDNLNHGSLGERVILYSVSINSFISSIPAFIFGIGETPLKEADTYSIIKSGISMHSELLDLAAKYGVVGVFIFTNMLKHTFSYSLELTTKLWIKNSLIILYISVVLYSVLNNVLNDQCQMIMIFLFLPLTVVLLEKKAI